MTLARLTLTLPEGSWLADVSRSHPDVRLRIAATLPGEDAGFTLVSVAGGDVEGALDSVTDHDAVDGVRSLGRSDGERTVQVDTDRPLLLRAAQRAGLPIEPPFTVREGRATIELVDSRERLSAFGRALAAFDVGYEIEFVGRSRRPEPVLTDTQAELVSTAVELGYYDAPRRCTLTELAEHVGIAKSTCSETLQRAEGRLMKRFAEADGRERWSEVSL